MAVNTALPCLLSLSELMFLETSALTGESVEDAFVQCARKILNKIESGTGAGGGRARRAPSAQCCRFSVFPGWLVTALPPLTRQPTTATCAHGLSHCQLCWAGPGVLAGDRPCGVGARVHHVTVALADVAL